MYVTSCQAGHAPVGPLVLLVHPATRHDVIVLFDIPFELIWALAPGHQPLTPLHSLSIIDILDRAQEVVHQGLGKNVDLLFIQMDQGST